MTILLINYEYPPIGAGAANATRHIAKALVELGHKAVVLTAGFRDAVGHTIEDGGVDVYRLPSRRASVSQSNPREMMSFVWHAWRALDRVVRTHKPDAAFIFFSIPCGLLGPTLKGRYGIPYTILLRGGDVPGMEPHLNTVHTLLRPVRRRILRGAQAVIANSKGLAEASMSADPIPVSVVPNGVDTDFFRPPAKRPDAPFTFLFVGRFQSQKNLPVVIDAFADAFAGTDVRLRLVGDGPQRTELEEQVARRGIASQVTFVPWLDKSGLLNEYQSAHCLINYSLYEGMPNVVLEAMACGLPAILSDIMGHEELGGGNLAIQLVACEDAEGLRAAMRVAHSTDRVMQTSTSSASRGVSWTEVSDELLRIAQGQVHIAA